MEYNFDWRNEISRIKAETDATFLVKNDENGTILDASARAEEIFEYHVRHELIGKSIDILVPERFRESHRKHRKAFSHHDARPRYLGSRDVSLVGLTKTGKEIKVMIGLRAAIIFGFEVVIVDVIEIKQ